MAGLSHRRRRLLLRRGVALCAALGFGLLLALAPKPLWAQAPAIIDVRVEGNRFFEEAVLLQQVRTQPNRRFLGVPGFTLWRWVYNLGEAGCCFSDRVAQAFRNSGEPPARLDAALLAQDVERLRLFYRQEGFRAATVEAEVDTLQADRVRVTFRVVPGEPTWIRSIRYPDLTDLAPDQRSTLLAESVLGPVADADADSLVLHLFKQRYSEPLLIEERRRLLRFLHNAGYAAVSRDSIRAIVYAAWPDSFDIAFRIRRGPRYRIGDVTIAVDGPEPSPVRRDTLYPEAGGQVAVLVQNERQLEVRGLLRSLRIHPGAWYSERDLLDTKRRLEATGLFSFTDLVAGTATVGADSTRRLPLRIELTTRRRHLIRLEGFMLQRRGGLGAGSEEVGLGTGASYTNLNWLGQGEVLQVRTAGSVAADFEQDLFTTAQAEAGATVTYPYLIGPFSGLEQALGLYEGRTHVSFSLLTARREELKLVIRGRAAAQFRLDLRHTPTLTSSVDLLDFQLSDPDTLSGFTGRFLRFVRDPVDSLRIVTDYNAPLVNNALRYTFRSATANPLRREDGHLYEGAIELGGNLPYLLDRFVFSPDSVEGALPRLPLFARDGDGSQLVYRQYVRVLMDLRRYVPVYPGTTVAWKLVGGWAHPIGQSEVVPFDRRFYAGGASSVRGWRLRQLGPGASSDPDAFVQGGDIKLEGSFEVRARIFRHLFGADWLGVLFADAGNVWFGPRNPTGGAGQFDRNFWRDFGVGGGLGLRLAWSVLIVRLDLAYPLQDPVVGTFPDRAPTFHFGIGHAF